MDDREFNMVVLVSAIATFIINVAIWGTLYLIMEALCAGDARAGVYLDLDVGALLTDLDGQTCAYISSSDCRMERKYLGNNGWLAIVRAGYETRSYKLWKMVHVSGHVYWQHMSDPADGHDSGINTGMTGARFSYE